MFSHSRMSAGGEFQVDGATTEKARWASSVCMQGTTSSGASEEHTARGDAWVRTSSLRYVRVAVVRTLCVSRASVASEAAAWRWCGPGSGRGLWPGCSGRAVVCQKSLPVRHLTAHCSSPAWKRWCCTLLSGRCRQSVDCLCGAERECASCRPLQRFSCKTRDSQTVWQSNCVTVKLCDSQTARWNQLELRCDRQSASGDVDGGDVGSWPELSRSADKDHLWLVSVELQAVLQESQANCGRAVGMPVDGRRGVGDEELCVVGEVVAWHAIRLGSAPQQLTHRQWTAAGRALNPEVRHSRTGSQEMSVRQDAWTADGHGDKTVFIARHVCIARTMPWQDVCLRVSPSVRHTPVLCLNGYTSFFIVG